MRFYDFDDNDIESISLCIFSVYQDVKKSFNYYFNFNLDLHLLPTSKRNFID